MAEPVVIQAQNLELGHPDSAQHLDGLNLVLPEFEGGEAREVDVPDTDEDGVAHLHILVKSKVLILKNWIFQSLMRGRTDDIWIDFHLPGSMSRYAHW